MNDFIVQLIARLDSSKTVDDVKKIEKELNAKGIQLKPIIDLAGSKQEIQNFAKQLQSILSNQGLDINTSKILSSINQVVKEVNSITSKANKIQLSIDNGHGVSNYQNQIDGLINDFQRYGVSAKEAAIVTSSLQTTFNNMKNMSGQELITQADKFEKEFKAVKVSVDQAKLAYDKFAQPVSQEKISSLLIRINNFLSKNTKITEDARQKLEAYIQELSLGNISLSKYNEINLVLKETDSTMRSLGRLGKSLKDQMSQAASSFTQWVSVSSAIMAIIYQLKKMPQAVYEVDNAMTNLYKVTDETSAKYSDFLDNSNKKAHELGRTVSSLIEQSADWAKLGFNIAESAKLAEYSSIYSNVGEVDDATAVSDMVTAMKAFNIEAEDGIRIIDSYNKLGNEFATSAAALGEGIRNSASALALGGNDIDQSLAMIAGMTEITQNAGESGNAIKILTMRLRGMKGELEVLGEDTEGIESISKIQTQLLNLSNNVVNIFDDQGNFKATYEIMRDIASVWDKMSKVDQAQMLEIIAGKQRGNSIAALIQAFQSGQVDKALTASMESAGSAMQEQERWMGSLEAKLIQLQTAFESLSQTLVDSSILKGLVDLGTSGVKALDGLVSFITPLGTLSATLGSIFGAKTSLDYRQKDTTHILQGSGKSYCYG